MISIKRSVLVQLLKHAHDDAPVEACGYLAGNKGIIMGRVPLRNTDKAADHFTLDPREQFEAVRAIRADNLDLLGVYHSHPASPARPSVEDIRLAYDPSLLYIIVSLTDTPAIRAFRIREGVVEEETLSPVE